MFSSYVSLLSYTVVIVTPIDDTTIVSDVYSSLNPPVSVALRHRLFSVVCFYLSLVIFDSPDLSLSFG